MSKNRNRYHWLKNLTALYGLMLLFACASVQSPMGGPKDTEAPRVVSENPKNMTRNFKAKTIEFEFNEFIRLNNEANEVSISPALERFPLFKARKQYLDITFEDTLEQNTTYTINFGKAVGDVNENNILTNYTYVFSTGDKIDSLSIQGQVVSAVTQEAQKDVTVFILPVRQDSLFGKRRASIFTTTDTAGTFKLNNLREDTYRIYALREPTGGDRIYNAGNEEIGFLIDSIKLTKDTANLKLQVFQEVPEDLRITDRKIENDGRITIVFNRPAEKPEVRVIDPPALDAKKATEFALKSDSALIWIPEMTFDSLKVAVAENGKNIDTVLLRRNKRDTYNRTISIVESIPNGRLKPGTDLVLTTSTPVTAFDPKQFSLLEDSVAVSGLQINRINGSARKFSVKYPWRAERNYDLKISEGAFTDIYGTKSRETTKKFILDDPENYGNLTIRVTPTDTAGTYLIQLLNMERNVLRTDSIPPSGRIDYQGYPTGKYLIRFVLDENRNGRWDTGSLKEKRQPEKIYNYQKTLTLRPNWDLEEPVTIPKDL